jgi:4-hydroxy-3-methylbut-2-enyl diphosphate reductase
MKVIIPATSGFCPGVKSAERKVFEIKKKSPHHPLFINGFLINNKRYIGYLEKNGVHMADTAAQIPAGATVFIRTHGIDRSEERHLRSRYRLEDLTCVKVKKIQREIARHACEGYDTVITGTKNHPEIKGLVSYAAGRGTVVEDKQDLDQVAERHSGTDAKIFLCSQTTGSRALFSLAKQRLAAVCGPDLTTRLRVYDSICPVTEKKEEEALRLQASADVSFVVGDKLSSNAKKLFSRLAAAKREVYFVEDLEELLALELPLSRFRRALVVSSASTPDFIERRIVEYLSSVTALQ